MYQHMPSRAEAQAKSKLITKRRDVTRRRNCPKWRGPPNKPWSHWRNTPLSFRIGSCVELVDAVALQTNNALSQHKKKLGETKDGEKLAHAIQNCQTEALRNREGPGEPLRSSLAKHHPQKKTIRKHGTNRTQMNPSGSTGPY